jgi:hypothetical protein
MLLKALGQLLVLKPIAHWLALLNGGSNSRVFQIIVEIIGKRSSQFRKVFAAPLEIDYDD